MKKNFKGLLAIWMAAAMMLAMMLPMAASATVEAPVKNIFLFDSDTVTLAIDSYIGGNANTSYLAPGAKFNTLDLAVREGKTLSGWNVWGATNCGYVEYSKDEYMNLPVDATLLDEYLRMNSPVHVIEPIFTENSTVAPSSRGAFLLFWFFHDVDFVIDEATTETVSVRYGDCIVAPEVTAPEGYEFTGWYTDADCTEAFDLATKFRSDVVRTVETLYAGFAPIAADETEDAE